MHTFKVPRQSRERSQVAGGLLGLPFLRSLEDLERSPFVEHGVRFDISEAGWLTPAEIVVLACAVRSIAERDITCILRLPYDPNSGLGRTLHYFRFAHALGVTDNAENWQKRITFEDYVPSKGRSGGLTKDRNILPLTWIDLQTFGYDHPPPNLYLEEPAFRRAYVDLVSAILSRGHFIPAYAIDDFVQGVLREIGWNAVLHSNRGKLGGIAAFAGQVFGESRSFEFAIADYGCGIAANLGPAYRRARANGLVPDYKVQYQCTEPIAVVRYAFDRGSTSRSEFPSEYEVNSDRGLSLVAEIVEESGSLSLASSGALVNVSATDGKGIRARSLGATVPGTCIYGELHATVAGFNAAVDGRVTESVSREEFGQVLPAYIPIRISKNRPIVAARRLLRLAKEIASECVLDIGFLDISGRQLENGLAMFIAEAHPQRVTLINSHTQRLSPSRIADRLRTLGHGESVVIRHITGHTSGRELCVLKSHLREGGSQDISQSAPKWQSISLASSTIAELHFRATTLFVQYGFKYYGIGQGFFLGEIHLLSGKVVGSYFSLVANIQASKDLSGRRWGEAFSRLLNIAVEDAEVPGTKLLGFAASMRPILNSLDSAHPMREEAYCLLSYDAPSRSELAEIVSAGDEVVLCTDVISTASLLREVISLVQRIGAKVVAVIALLDARDEPSDSWNSIVNEQTGAIPLLLAGAMRRGRYEPAEGDVSYWVDTVSAIPLATEPYSAIDLEKVTYTVRLLHESGAVSVGHFVSGLRHYSVRIDMGRLLERREEIVAATEAQLNKIKNHPEWRDFRPAVALVPAGINRLDRLRLDGETGLSKPFSELYAELVCSLFAFAPQIFLVPRTFEPGGQARCAAVEYIANANQVSDIILVDDGISSGATIRSLVHQAVRVGAKRILVFTLLARTNPDDLEQWALTHGVSDGTIAGHALIQLIYPLHLPIPFSIQSDCPQCATLRSLDRRRLASGGMESAWQAIEKDLSAPYVYEPSVNSPEFTATWIEVHALAEIASKSAGAFERLSQFLNSLRSASRIDRIRREAVIRLFLVEWRLLGRARLRQVTRRTVRELALEQLDSVETDATRYVEALSLLRMLYPADYVRLALSRLEKLACDPIVVERVIVHLRTLDPVVWALERSELIRGLVDSLTLNSAIKEETKRRLIGILEELGSNPTFGNQSINVVRRVIALQKALTGPIGSHDVIPSLSEVRKITPERLEEEGNRGYFKLLATQIDQLVLRAVERDICPLLDGLAPLIGLQLENLRPTSTVRASYFERRAGEESESLVKDVEGIFHAIRNIADGVQSRSALQVASHGALRALERAFLPTSLLRRVLDSLTEMQVNGVVSLVVDSLRGFMPAANIQAETTDEELAATTVLCPELFVTQFAALVKSNLQKHVLDSGFRERDVRIYISAKAYVTGSDNYVVVRVSNNGRELKGPSTPSINSRTFNRRLKLVDGVFVPAERAREGFSSSAKLQLRLTKEAQT